MTYYNGCYLYNFMQKPMSTSTDYDPDGDNSGISLPSENGLLLGFKPELTKLVLCYGQEGCFNSF